jgi:peptidoglycan/xylan/chitin deacetylase (PgdA/CDA1 family)
VTAPDSGAAAPYCLLTNDVEEHSIWHNRLRDETAEKVLREGMPLLLDLYARHGVKSTFYFTGTIAEKFPEVVRMVVPHGHEVGCHGLSHEVHHGFDVMPYDMQREHLRRARAILEEVSGAEVISFRAPALRVSERTTEALLETGFRTDSSVASQRFDMFLSFGSLKKTRWLTAPRRPYRTDPTNLFRPGAGPLVEVPLSAALFPYLGTTMRIFPLPTRLLRRALDLESRRTGKPIVFDTHPNEFIEEAEGRRVVHRRTRNPVSYLLRDVVRGRLKLRNLGRAAEPLYEREIRFFRRAGYRFVPVRTYCQEAGLL